MAADIAILNRKKVGVSCLKRSRVVTDRIINSINKLRILERKYMFIIIQVVYN